jgi:hypothetical protein
MPKVNWVLPCLKATVDANSGTVSLIEIIEGIKIQQQVPVTVTTVPPIAPAQPPGAMRIIPIQFDIVVVSQRKAGEPPSNHKARVQMLDPTGLVLGTSDIPVVDLLNGARNRTIVHLGAMPITVVGSYTIRVEFYDVPTGSWVTEGETEIDLDF